MTLRLLSLDLSLAATGIASTHSWRGEPGLCCDTIHTRRSTPDGIDHPRIAAVVAAIRPYLTAKPDLAVIEWLPQFDGHGDMSLRLAELHGVVKHYLWLQKVPVADVQPPQLKIYATGKGNATKTAVRAAITARVGRLVHIADDNQADAVTLLAMASAHYGQPMEQAPSDKHRRALDAVRWPVVEDRETAAGLLAAGSKAGQA